MLAKLWHLLTAPWLSREFRDRPRELTDWSARYGETCEKDVLVFLQLFADTFMLSSKQIPHLRPVDRPIDLYRMITRGGPDSMEIEFFLEALEDQFDIHVDDTEFEAATLGQLFEATTAMAKKPLSESVPERIHPSTDPIDTIEG